MNWRLIAGLIALALLALATSWLLKSVRPAAPQQAQPPTHTPDYYFRDAIVTETDDHGRESMRMHADAIFHHPDDDSTDLENVDLLYYKKDGPPWHVLADRGHVPSGGDVVELAGNIRMTRAPTGAGTYPLKIRTNTLTVFTRKNLARTRDPVSISEGVNTFTGVGMEADLDKDRLVLEANVEGHYER